MPDFAFVLAGELVETQLEGESGNRHKAGGRSQVRYGWHFDNQRQHAEQTVPALDRIVRQREIGHMVIARMTALGGWNSIHLHDGGRIGIRAASYEQRTPMQRATTSVSRPGRSSQPRGAAH